MLSSPRKSRRWSAVTALATLAVMVGCSRLPVEPEALEPGTYVNPVFVAVPRAASSGFGAVSTGPLTGSGVVDGSAGGQISVGRFTVTVPPGAFAGSATISIEIPDQGIVSCNLEISPASANHFDAPVSLRADCAGATNVDLRNCGTLWFDTEAGVWRTVTGSVVDLTNETVTASLQHFSTYGVADLLGKASW